jgi:ubiquinone/menaquinone biosynthesis C-methylase UbiE
MTFRKTVNTKSIYDNVFGNNSTFYKLIPHKDIRRLSSRIKKVEKNFSLKNKKILIAGGSGRSALAFLKYNPKSVVYIDLVPKNIFRIKSINKNVKCINSDMDNIKKFYSQNYFDVIYLEGIFQHLNNPEKTFLKLYNVLKNEGYFYLDFYRSGIIYSLLTELARKKISFGDFKKYKLFLEKNKLNKKKISYSSSNLSERLYDDLFVPNIRFYDAKKTRKSFLKSKMKIAYFDNFKKISQRFDSYTVFHSIIKKRGSIKNIKIKDENNEKIFKKFPKYQKFIKDFTKLKFQKKNELFKVITKMFLLYSQWYHVKNPDNTIKILNNFIKKCLK